ncbi:hypothetical protein [Thermoplasma volcanium GSS1]|uniref:Uncharacterized protein n=1 Tax=Thermoplasma volcanium (strain ATCC 51530 / DSM 4299 / JCM 9571 / NBRC 15438 / GSS1) TaxID=273116 RepID=Q978Z1_THEVO|nr:DUF981 family protein [Thermoplasma volcanium]BAB60415.1 hypothetical protein [Thermoplasma volcanium GSS1]
MSEFIDPLAVMLLGLGMGTALGAAYFLAHGLNKRDAVKSLVVPAFGVGFFDFVSGFIMSFTWPLPSSYNMLFGDPLLMFGLILMMSSYMEYRGFDLRFNSILLLFLGIYVLVASAGIVHYKLETGDDLLSSMGLYILDGIAAVLAPIMYIKPENGKYLYLLEFIILLLGTFVALFIGYEAIWGHLLDFIKYFP